MKVKTKKAFIETIAETIVETIGLEPLGAGDWTWLNSR